LELCSLNGYHNFNAGSSNLNTGQPSDSKIKIHLSWRSALGARFSAVARENDDIAFAAIAAFKIDFEEWRDHLNSFTGF
jgi:hypothetical protein